MGRVSGGRRLSGVRRLSDVRGVSGADAKGHYVR
jgi:hypothetical protein